MEKGDTRCSWWKWKLGQPLWKTLWRFLKKLKTAIPLRGFYPEEMKTGYQRDIFAILLTKHNILSWYQRDIQEISHAGCSIIYNSQNAETPVSVNEWRKRRLCTHTHSYTRIRRNGGVLLNRKKKHVLCDNMARPWGHYAQWDKSDTERQIPRGLTSIQILKKLNTEILEIQSRKKKNTE